MHENEFITDKKLSWKAKGILAYLINVNKKASINELIKVSKDQRTAVHTGLNELKETGYLKRFPIRNELGRFEMYMNEITIKNETEASK